MPDWWLGTCASSPERRSPSSQPEAAGRCWQPVPRHGRFLPRPFGFCASQGAGSVFSAAFLDRWLAMAVTRRRQRPSPASRPACGVHFPRPPCHRPAARCSRPRRGFSGDPWVRLMADDLPWRTLGRSGIAVPAVGIGCWAIGGPDSNLGLPMGWDSGADERAAAAGLEAAWAGGARLFDTADIYGHGRSERLIGRLVAGVRRDEIVLSSKVGYFAGTAEHGFEPGHMCASRSRRWRTLEPTTWTSTSSTIPTSVPGTDGSTGRPRPWRSSGPRVWSERSARQGRTGSRWSGSGLPGCAHRQDRSLLPHGRGGGCGRPCGSGQPAHADGPIQRHLLVRRPALPRGAGQQATRAKPFGGNGWRWSDIRSARSPFP